jgi:hypothetical protein
MLYPGCIILLRKTTLGRDITYPYFLKDLQCHRATGSSKKNSVPYDVLTLFCVAKLCRRNTVYCFFAGRGKTPFKRYKVNYTALYQY